MLPPSNVGKGESIMATINVGGNTVTYGFGSIIALIVLILAIILMVISQTLTPLMVLGFIAALALARLT